MSAGGGNASNPEVALSEAGIAVAVWSHQILPDSTVQGAVRPAGGPWGAAQDLSEPSTSNGNAQVVLDSAGNALAVWERWNGVNQIVQSASRPTGGAWQAPNDLSADGQDANRPQLALDGAGNALAVWERFNGTHVIAQWASRPAGSVWQAALNLSAPGQDAFDPKVALNEAGNALAVWQRWNGASDVAQGTARPAGGIWQSPQDLSATGQNAFGAQVGLSDAGNGLAVWVRSNGTNDIVQGALYDEPGPTTSTSTSASAPTSATSTSTSATSSTSTSASAATSSATTASSASTPTASGPMPRSTRHRVAACSRKDEAPGAELPSRHGPQGPLEAPRASHRSEPTWWRRPRAELQGQSRGGQALVTR